MVLQANRRTRVGALAVALAALAAMALPAQAQTIIYTNNFDTGLGGFTVTSSAPPIVWAADNTPFAGSSIPNSLNYNNGINYETPIPSVANNGSASSPLANIAGTINPQLQFLCRFDTEGLNPPLANMFDTRHLDVLSSTGTVLLTKQYLNPVGPIPPGITEICFIGVAWHSHTLDLTPYIPSGNIRIRYRFNTVDGISNFHQGWFIDNFTIQHAGGGGPPPPGGGPGPGGPFTGFPTGDGGSPNNNDGGGNSPKGCGTVALLEEPRHYFPWVAALTALLLLLAGLVRPGSRTVGAVASRSQRR